MAASLANIVKVTGSAVTTVTTAGVTTQAAGSTFVVSVAEANTQTVNTPTDSKTNTYTQVGTKQTSTGGTPSGLSVYAKENGTGGASHTATVTFGASSNPTVFFSEVAGVLAASIDTASRAQGSDAATPYTITSGTLTQADNLVLCFFAPDGAGTGTASFAESTGFTISGQETNGSSFWLQAVGSKSVLATTALTPSWTEPVVTTSAGLHIIAFKSAGATVYAVPGAWSWAGSLASLTGLPDTAFQQNAFQSNAFQIFGGSTGAAPTTLSATPGAWSWAGSTATFPVPQVSVTPGAWTWSGSTQAFTQLINAAPGTWSWAGSTQTTTQLINQITGGWTWAGSTQSLTQLINATPGTWTWTGSTQATTQLINATAGAWTWAGSTASITAGIVEINATPGLWSWVGSTATFPSGVTTIDTTPGTWTWTGSTAEIPTQISAIAGTWTWNGSNATTTQLVNAIPGAFSWVGSTAAFSQAINATPGLWSWAGSVQGIVSQVKIDATPGNWTWAGSRSTISQQSEATGGWPIYYPRKKKRTEPVGDEEATEQAIPAIPAAIPSDTEKTKRATLRAKRRADRVMAELKAIYAEQDALNAQIEQAKIAADDEMAVIALLLAMM